LVIEVDPDLLTCRHFKFTKKLVRGADAPP